MTVLARRPFLGAVAATAASLALGPLRAARAGAVANDAGAPASDASAVASDAPAHVSDAPAPAGDAAAIARDAPARVSNARAHVSNGVITGSLEVRDLVEAGRRFTLVRPTHLAAGERAPLVVLLHGLGETTDASAGAFAWVERYGLLPAYERLRTLLPSFRGMVLACPHMPNVAGSSDAIDAYARWLALSLVPRVRRAAPALPDDQHTTIGGCSLGGYVSLEIFLRRPDAFAAWGGVQTAIGEGSAMPYAARLAAAVARDGAPPRALSLVTSTEDPFRKANEALARALTRGGVAHALRVLPGPHSQPWLREVGTLETLLFHARVA